MMSKNELQTILGYLNLGLAIAHSAGVSVGHFGDTDFLQLAHGADERYTVRDGINVARFAIKLKSLATERTHETEALELAVTQVLGEEALRYVRSNRPSAT